MLAEEGGEPGMGEGVGILYTRWVLLDSNPLVCDDRMYWLKEAENQGRVKVWEYYEYEPCCVNLKNTLWSEVQLER